MIPTTQVPDLRSQTSFLKITLKHSSQYGFLSLSKNAGSSKGLLQRCKKPTESAQQFDGSRERLRLKETRTHLTTKALPTPLPAKRLHGLHMVPDTLLAFLAFGQPKSHVARRAVRMPFVNDKVFADSCFAVFITTTLRGVGVTEVSSRARIQKRISTLGAEKVLLVVCPRTTELGVVKGYEVLVDDGRAAGVAARGEELWG